MKICFFAKVPDQKTFENIGYYREDLEILRGLGHEVVLATRFRGIPWNCDLYFTWWFGWGILALLKSKLVRKPNIMVGPIHYYDREFGFLRRPYIQQWLIRLCLRFADAAVTVSEIEYAGIKSLGAKNPYMVYHSSEAPTSVPSLSERSPLIFSIGHLCSIGIARKGFDNVVRAIPYVLEKFPDARFVIAGRPGNGFGKLESLRRELGIEAYLEFPGAIDSQTRSEYLQRAMVLVQPASYEGFGLAQLEAMSHGVPVVTSPAGAVAEVVGDCGLYCDKNKPEEIARQICRLLGDPELWIRLSSCGRERALVKFSRKARRERIAEIIELATKKTS